MLINKLIDGLDTPDLVQNKELPVPNGMQQQPTPTTTIQESLLAQSLAKDEKLNN